jgi:hypothetical protein
MGLLDYPLSPSRLQGHVAFLLTNTAYEHETGRLQALEMLQQVRGLCYGDSYLNTRVWLLMLGVLSALC